MTSQHNPSDLKLEKLGIREIEERLEVSPIVADPGSLGSGFAPGLEALRDGDSDSKYRCFVKVDATNVMRAFEYDE